MAGYRRFSLRTLVLVTTAATLWIGYASYRANRQRRAVEALQGQGAQVRYAHEFQFDAKHGPIPRGEISNPSPPGPDWLRGVVGEHYFMRPLVVWHVKDPAPLVDLAGVEEIYGLQLDDREAEHLRATPRLKVLMLNKTSTVSDYGFLVELPELVHFAAIGLEFDDEDAQHLKSLPNLLWLQLSKTKITDDGLVAVSALPQLELLNLTDTAITVASVKRLAELKSLKRLSIGRTKISEEGVERLKRALPTTVISVK